MEPQIQYVKIVALSILPVVSRRLRECEEQLLS